MKEQHWKILKIGSVSHLAILVGVFVVCLSILSIQTLDAADYGNDNVEWRFESGLDRGAFVEAVKRLSKENFRIADIESYRSGRSATVTTIWTKLAEKDRWAIKMSLPIADFLKVHKEHQEKGYALVEFEVDRLGATLHFSGIWLKSEAPLDTEFYFGIESLGFSNRYGEMADRGYRLIDFEAYESNGKFRNAGVWLKNDGQEVRFYRVIPKRRFGEIAANMQAAGFRMLDLEGYNHEGKYVFAAEWVRLVEGQESAYDYDLIAGEFYNKNSMYLNDGYRLTEFEVYEENGTTYYAGSWLKSDSEATVVGEADGEKKMSLKAFRSEEE